MKRTINVIAISVLLIVFVMPSLMAGNDNRRGTAGASELLINPWARSSGWGSVNVANSRGIDAFYNNIAGLSFVNSTEVAYSNTLWMGGKTGLSSGASINAFGVAQRVGEKGALGFYVMTMSFGDIPVTTVDSPDPGVNGTFSLNNMNINIAYSHSFTASIHGGANIKIVNESTADITGSGFAIDAGIQYVTGEYDEIKFGISLKNIGFGFSFDGNGISTQYENESGNTVTVEYRSADMELPTALNIGASYDFLFEKWDQRLTLAGNFTSNAFTKDNFIVGAEYSLLNMFQLRGAYVYQRGLVNDDDRTTALSGLTCGASFEIPLNKKKGGTSALIIDYSYRAANPFKGSHSFGATIKL